MNKYVQCRCGERHEVYDGYRNCPMFYQRIIIASNKSGYDPIHLLSTGKWKEINVDNDELGLTL